MSDGPGAKAMFMPDLVNKGLAEARALLSTLHVEVVPCRVGGAGERDVVLEQTPDAGSMLQEGQMVTFDVRTSPSTVLANAKRKEFVVYTVPDMSFSPQVRVDVVDAAGARKTVFPTPGNREDGAPLRFEPGTTITIPIVFTYTATVECLLDGNLDRTYAFGVSGLPTITDHRQPLEENADTVESLDVPPPTPAATPTTP